MRNLNTWLIVFILIVMVIAIWSLLPSFQFLTLPPAVRGGNADSLARYGYKEEWFRSLQKKALHLGLDLQGGIRLVLAVDEASLAKTLGVKPSELKTKDISEARDKALTIIRNRVDQFGVSEPLINPEGPSWISVQLPGMVNAERAREIIGKTGLMEWKLVQESKTVQDVLTRIDGALAKASGVSDSLAVESSHLFTAHATYDGRQITVMRESIDTVNLMLRDSVVQSAIPPDMEFLWGRPEERDMIPGAKPLFLLKRDPEVTGASLVEARMGIGTENNPAEPRVDFVLARKEAAKFSVVTAANINRQLAIVLDSIVQSAPVIRSRIPDGRGQIELGSGSSDEAKDLAVILKAGALPAKIAIVHSEIVSQTLGADSIQKGKVSAIVGFLLVALLMAIYYRISGLIADVGLVFNLLFLMAFMAGLHATLTMPGIAGIILSIGMSVDSNVLVFERIREEMRAGKTVRTAIDAGYNRALASIIDSHVTTLITSMVLFWFGSGPIRGFAVTLGLGVAISLFTALVITKVIFDTRKQYRTLSI